MIQAFSLIFNFFNIASPCSDLINNKESTLDDVEQIMSQSEKFKNMCHSNRNEEYHVKCG
jgi:hypothetical protein